MQKKNRIEIILQIVNKIYPYTYNFKIQKNRLHRQFDLDEN